MGRSPPSHPPRSPRDDATEPAFTRGAAFGPGSFVDGFRIVRPIGTGGNATVYLARTEPDGAEMALKVVPAAASSEAVARRLVREADFAQRLRHPGLVEVRQLGLLSGGGMYLAMELLDGEDLRQRLTRGPLDPREVVRIGVAIASALEVAHASGILHRDVKPSNVFLCRDGTVKLLDLGLAKSTDERERSVITTVGEIVGTPSYMAPEQAHGTRDEDERTDVWGLAATLYHALSGQPPFSAPSTVAQLVRIVSSAPDPLPASVPPGIAHAVGLALRRERAERWRSVAAFRTALEAAITAPSWEVAREVELDVEVRLICVLMATGVDDYETFAAAVRAHEGAPSRLRGAMAVGQFGGTLWRGDEAERAVDAGLAARAAGVGARLAVATGHAVRSTAGAVAGAVVAAAMAALSAVGIGMDAATAERVRDGFEIVEGRARARRAIARVRPMAAADGPLVGRERELADLEATLREVAGLSEARGVVLEGPPGIGKSRICRALVAAGERAGVRVLEGGAEPSRALEGWHAIAPALGGAVPDGALPAGASGRDPSVAHDRVLAAIGDWFEQRLGEGPVLLVVEDVHWADGSSLELLDLLSYRFEHRPLMIVVTARPPWAGALGGFRRVVLGGVGRLATRALVRGAGASIDAAAADSIHDRTGGNPFFIVELAVAMAQGRTGLPESVQGALQGRLDALKPEDKELLRRASVLGPRFERVALSALGNRDVAAALERLHRADLVQPLGTDEWRFRHALLQEVAYGTLTEPQRRALHGRAAAAIASLSPGAHLEIAQHLEHAGEPDAAGTHWIAAATQAFAIGDIAGGLPASTRALARGPVGPEAFTLGFLRSHAFFQQGDPEAEGAEIERLAALAASDDERARVLALRIRSLSSRGDTPGVLERIAEAEPLMPDRPYLMSVSSVSLSIAGDPEGGRRLAERALEAARLPEDTTEAYIALDCALATMGDLAGCLDLTDRQVEAAEQSGNLRLLAAALGSRGDLELASGMPAAARGFFERARQLAARVGARRLSSWQLGGLARVTLRTGDAEAGLRGARAALQLADELRFPRLRAMAEWVSASALLACDRPAEALDAIDRAAASATPDMEITFLATRAQALAALGRGAEVRDQVAAAVVGPSRVSFDFESEAHLLLVAHRLGIAGALERGLALVRAQADRIRDPVRRTAFLTDVPSHAALLAASRT